MLRYILETRLCGSVVNTTAVVATACAFILEKHKSALVEYGGHIEVTSAYAKSLLK